MEALSYIFKQLYPKFLVKSYYNVHILKLSNDYSQYTGFFYIQSRESRSIKVRTINNVNRLLIFAVTCYLEHSYKSTWQ